METLMLILFPITAIAMPTAGIGLFVIKGMDRMAATKTRIFYTSVALLIIISGLTGMIFILANTSS